MSRQDAQRYEWEPGWQFGRSPLPAQEIDFLNDDEDVSDVGVFVTFGEEAIRPLFAIVEMWPHKEYGRVKRAFEREFDEKERRSLRLLHARLERYYLRSGIPHKGVVMKPATYRLAVRAANFFVLEG